MASFLSIRNFACREKKRGSYDESIASALTGSSEKQGKVVFVPFGKEENAVCDDRSLSVEQPL